MPRNYIVVADSIGIFVEPGKRTTHWLGDKWDGSIKPSRGVCGSPTTTKHRTLRYVYGRREHVDDTDGQAKHGSPDDQVSCIACRIILSEPPL